MLVAQNSLGSVCPVPLTVRGTLLDELDAEKEKFAMQQVGDTFKDRFEAADAKKKRVRQRFVE